MRWSIFVSYKISQSQR